MRRQIVWLSLTLFFVYLLSACQNMSGGTAEENFRAEILSVSEGKLLVEPLEGENARFSADCIAISTKDLPPMDVSVGDIISIAYTGTIAESYPAQVTAVGWQMIKRADAITVADEITITFLPQGREHKLTASDCEKVASVIVNQKDWIFGIPNCAFDYRFTFDDKEYFYHSDCGTLQERTHQLSITLSKEQKEELNAFLESIYK